jgi:hypothetical protein
MRFSFLVIEMAFGCTVMLELIAGMIKGAGNTGLAASITEITAEFIVQMKNFLSIFLQLQLHGTGDIFLLPHYFNHVIHKFNLVHS